MLNVTLFICANWAFRKLLLLLPFCITGPLGIPVDSNIPVNAVRRSGFLSLPPAPLTQKGTLCLGLMLCGCRLETFHNFIFDFVFCK